MNHSGHRPSDEHTIPELSVVIPCYRSDESLEQLLARLQQVLDDALDRPYEVILVDDGSPELSTWATIERLCSRYQFVRGVQLTRNFGKPNALVCGYHQSRGDYVLAMDDDLQHRPEDIPLLLAQRPCDLAMGGFGDRKHAWWQRRASAIKSWLDGRLIGKPGHVYLSPFHLIRRNVLDAMLGIRTPNPHIGALMMHVTRDVQMVPVSHDSRSHGRSNYTFRTRFRQFSNLLVNNSSLLLRGVALMGSLLAFMSFLFGAYLLFQRLFGEQLLPGWTSLMVVTLFVGGVLMLSLGVVGEYLLRIINGIENRPGFVIKKSVGANGEA